ncbi:MAG: hypothetical protein FWC67_01230 [Defluviitaleaceae bacterium]|nr:hypothetical protein [Defluviitaleaceae bacterium]
MNNTRWEDFRKELLTPEEKAASDLRVAMMVELTRNKNISEKHSEKLCDQLDIIMEVLAPLGKALQMYDLKAE